MKNKFLRVTKLFAIVTIILLGLNNTVTNVKAAPSSINIGGTEAIPKLIGQTYFAIMKTTSGEYVYCLDINKQTVRNQTLTLVGERDAGFAYLMQNGYPAKNITGDRISDIYITQTAVWWYLDSTTGSSNLSNNFKTTASDSRGLRPYISNLVNGAINARNKGYATTSIKINNNNKVMSLSSDKKYFVSDPISVTSSNIGNYQVSVNNSPSGTIITTESGQQANTFSPNAKFLVKVPVSNVTSNSVSLSISVKATGTVYKAYEYKPADSNRYQNVMTSILSPVTTNVSDNITLNIETSKITIIKINKETGKPLAGASLVLKDSNGRVVASWTTTTNAQVIKNLSNGTYTLEETKAPTGYKKLDKAIKIQITSNNRDQKIVVSNEENKGNVSIIKVDKETGKALAGAKFVLKNSNGKTIATWTSTTKAYVIENLENGTYTLEETKAPTGYKKLENKITFKITSTDKIKTIRVSNEEEKGKISILKIDKETSKALAGAKFILKDSNGKTVASWTSTTKAYVIENLEKGTYSLEEIEAPKGYKKIEKPITIKIDDDNKNQTIKVSNEAKTTVVNIIKIDASTGNTLPGAVLVVKDSTGKEIAKFTTTDEPYVLINLEDGTYTVEEISAPAGYKLSTEIKKFTIDEQHLSHQITFENQPEFDVPNTSSNSSIIMYILGIAFIGGAAGFVYKNGKTK